MKISKLVVMATVCSTLSACSVEEMAAVNKKISDGAFAVTKALNGGTGYADNGMPILNKQLPPEQDKRENIIDVPVDVDTAAGRLKRYYKFYSNDEVNAIRNNGTTDGNGRQVRLLTMDISGMRCRAVTTKWEETGVKAALMIT